MTNIDRPGDLDGIELERAIARLIRLVEASSPSTDSAGLFAFADLLAGELSACGLEPTVERAEGSSGTALPLLTADSPRRATRPLLLIGHIDTVLPAAPARREDGKLYATGAIDMKGGIATLVGALDLLRRREIAPPPGLRLALVPDEEVAGPLSRRVTAREGASARAVWVLEPGEPTADGGETIVIGRRGMATFQLQVAGRAAHSGLHFWNGRSAIAAAAEWSVTAVALSRPDEGPTVNVARLVGGDRDFVEHLAERAALLGGDAQLNIVPDRAVADGEFRFLRASDREVVATALEVAARDLAARHEVEIRLELGGDVPPVEATASRLAAAEHAVACAAARGWALVAERDRGGISFPNFLPAGATVPVLDGLGPVGGGMHTRGEFVDLRSFARRIVLLADLLAAESSSAG